MQKIRLAKNICPEELRSIESGVTILELLKKIMTSINNNIDHLFLRNDISHEKDWEKNLYSEPKRNIFKEDYVWHDVKQQHSGLEYYDFINTENLYSKIKQHKPQVIYLFGDTGCGKSTFLAYFQKEYVKREGDKSCCLRISFRVAKVKEEKDYDTLRRKKFAEIGNKLKGVIKSKGLYASYRRYILNNIHHPDFDIYQEELSVGKEPSAKELDKTIGKWRKENPSGSLTISTQFLRSKGYKIVLLLDDVDRMPVCYQKMLAEDAKLLAFGRNLQVIVTFRFYSLEEIIKVAKVIESEYESPVLAKIDLPDIPDLLIKRMQYYLFNQLTRSSYTIVTTKKGNTATVDRERLIDFVRYVTEELLLSETVLSEFISVSDMNIPFLLKNYAAVLDSPELMLTPDMVVSFFESENKSSSSFVDMINIKPYDLFLKSMAMEGRKYFSHRRSRLCNLFWTYDKKIKNGFKQLLKIYILRLIYNLTIDETVEDVCRDFIEKSKLFEEGSKLGWKKTDIDLATHELFKKALLFGYTSNKYESTKKLALSNPGLTYNNSIYRMVYYMYFMSGEVPVDINSIKKHFYKVAKDDFGDECWKLQKKWSSLINDEFIHFWTAEFIHEIIRTEKEFILWSFTNKKNPEAVKVYKEYIQEPISVKLVNSFCSHVTKARKKGFANCMSQLKKAKRDLLKIYNHQVKLRLDQ